VLDEWEALGLIALAALLGGAIGFERETAEKAAGLRTHMLVAAASALIVLGGELLLQDRRSLAGDPARALHAVVTGIGFICAGTILRNTDETRVRGLTTAASLFFVAGIGVMTGLQYLVVAVGGTVLALIALRGVPVVERYVARRTGDREG
jgi:putative Mg2+ transporter-C (MgtC) family protein